MASNLKSILETGSHARGSECRAEEADSELDLEKLESDVKKMAQRILHYRGNLPEQLKSTFASILAAQRPVVAVGLEAETGTSRALTREEGAVQDEGEKESAEKMQIFEDKLSQNVSLMPKVLKRMKDNISTIDRLDSYNGIIHPAFKTKKIG